MNLQTTIENLLQRIPALPLSVFLNMCLQEPFSFHLNFPPPFLPSPTLLPTILIPFHISTLQNIYEETL